jgi:hypothetical protein
MFTFQLIPTYCDRDRRNLEVHRDRAKKHRNWFQTHDMAERAAIETTRLKNQTVRNPNKGFVFEVVPV